MKKKRLTYIDIFAGCGGLSLGFINAGWKGIIAIEKNKDAFKTLNENLINRGLFSWPKYIDVMEYDINRFILKYKNKLHKLKVDLVVGGPPCQGFSMAGSRNCDDIRNKLVNSYIKFIKIIKPKYLFFENVVGFNSEFRNNDRKVLFSQLIIKKIKNLGYNVEYRVVNMSEYGIPQNRKRFILIAMKNIDPQNVFQKLNNNKEKFFKKKNINQFCSVGEALGDIEEINGKVKCDTESKFYYGLYSSPKTKYQILMRKGVYKKIPDSHRFVNHTDRIIKLHSKLICLGIKDKRIVPSDNYVEGLKRRGVTVLDRTRVSPTVTSIPDDMIHYSEPRVLTVREMARLQSFPDWFEFKGKFTSGGKLRKKEVPRYTQVANAVPPLFSEQIANALMEVVKKYERKN